MKTPLNGLKPSSIKFFHGSLKCHENTMNLPGRFSRGMNISIFTG